MGGLYGVGMHDSGRAVEEVLADLADRQGSDPPLHAGRLFGLVYPTGRSDIEALTHAVYERFLFSNALNPLKFANLAQIEREVVQNSSELVHRPASEHGAGVMTSGGTESILLSMLASRRRARARGIERPQILAPVSAHPAYAKAAHYFDMELVSVPLDQHWRADVSAMNERMSERTAVVVASAFCYPYGIMDPVGAIGALARERGVDCHVDACIGGFILPFLEMLGYDVEPWDFRVDGVTQMSMDVHKYGYVPKGASVLLHRDEDWFWNETFFYDQWGSGLYATTGIAGARSGAPAAAAWAVMQYLGIEGYRAIASELMETVARFSAGVASIGALSIVGAPVGPVLALRSDDVDLHAVADVMDERGWHLNRNTVPHGVQLMLSPAHRDVLDELLADLADAVRHHGKSLDKPVRYS